MVKGDRTMHGQTRPVMVNVREAAGRFTGAARLKQSDSGITPIQVEIEFDMQLAR